MNVIALLAFSAALPWFKRAAVPARAEPDTELQLLDDAGQEEPLLGCGWFDSSHELNRGLTVREDVAATELPLANWLELHLGVWRAPGLPA